MRTVLAFVLLAGVSAPVLAAGSGDRPGHHGGNQSASEDRGDRPSRSNDSHADRGSRGGNDNSSSQSNNSGNSERSHFSGFARPDRGGNDQVQPVTHVETNSGGGTGHAEHVTRVETSGGNGSEAREPRFHHGFVSRVSSGDESSDQPTRHDTLRSTTGNLRSGDSPRFRGPKVIEAPQDVSTRTLRQSDRRLPAVFRNRVPIVSNTPHEGTQPPRRVESRRTNWASWSTSHWRSDRKYDWKDHRRRHRSLFHLSFYSDPFGWSYRPYQIGWRLWPSYYSSNFWLNDPWQYRLPYAPPGYRWIRYYDDAILVDTWDGRVVDVIYNFFW